MLNVYLGGILLVLGIIALLAQPTAGVVMIGAGYWIFQRASPGERHQASSLFWGCAMVCMIIVTLASA
ncbi:hypothetical protein [Pseudomonas oleovorans]|uniref:Uncharacterized protein n=1 Tax=Ectopseudomonas oleovorans TaxID=301 RepID=A0A3R8X7Q0_ECTOL|nr:hypothetical protein [Pseudomonas oleovorans]RRW27460.1 hypothetical protein EGJ44_21685 [Pseudomonas oleovorans]